MKTWLALTLSAWVFLTLTGCGGGSKNAPPITYSGIVEGYVYIPQDASQIYFSRQNEPPAGYRALTGSIVRAEIENTVVETTTDEFGHFTIRGLPEGLATITISPPLVGGMLPELKSFSTTLQVKANTTAYIGTDGQISLIGYNASYLDVLINQIGLDNFPQITLYLSIIDPVLNTPIIGLTKNQFEIQINGQDATTNQLEQVASASSPASICLVLDTSGSMAGEQGDFRPLLDLKEAGKEFVGFLSSRDQIGIISFNDDVYMEQEFTSDISLLTSAIDQLNAEGKTSLYDAVAAGIRETALTDTPRKAVVLMTDGGENNSQNTDFYSMMDMVKQANIPVYTLGLQGYDFTREESSQSVSRARSEQELQLIARESAGEYFYIPQSSNLMGIYTKVTQRNQQQYILKTTATNLRTDDYQVALKVTAYGLNGYAYSSFQYLRFNYPINPALYSTLFATKGFYENGHLGEDFALPEGAPIKCVGSGKIVQYEAHSGYGELAAVVEHRLVESRHFEFYSGHRKSVEIQYFCSIYGHIRPSKKRDSDPLDWKVGDPIERGDIIGYINDNAHNGIGSEHLHMGIRLGAAPGYWVFYGYENSDIPQSSVENFVAFSELIERLQAY